MDMQHNFDIGASVLFQKSLLGSSLRRVGDVCLSYVQSKPFSPSPECRIRVLSCLVLLQTFTQG